MGEGAAVVERLDLHEVVPAGEFLHEATVEGNIIQNVSLLGSVSRNGRVYTREAMQDAVRLYNGVQVFADHPSYNDLTGTGGRKFMDLAGKILNTRLSGDRVRGDVHLIAGHSVGENLKTIAEQMPDLVGFSHRAKGESETAEDGTVVIKRLTEVKALEIVVDPATTDGLFESTIEQPEEQGEEEMKDLKAVTMEELKAQRPDLLEGITEAVRKDLEAQADQDTELTEAKERITELEAENKDLQSKLDEAEVAIATRERQDLIDEKLAEAELPDEAVTDRFKKDLQEAKDEAAVDEIIADRKALVESLPKNLRSGQPRQPARKIDDVVEGKGEEPKPVTDDVVGDAMQKAFS